MSEGKDPKYFKVGSEILDNIVKYLSSRPWNEVNGVLAPLLNQAIPLPDVDDPKVLDVEESEE